MADWVLDASAVLALVHSEPGFDRVLAVLASAQMTAVNAAEVVTALIREGLADEETARLVVVGLGCQLVAVDAELGLRAGMLAGQTSAHQLSLGARCCLALAEREGATALTADPSWTALDLPVRIATIR